MSKRRDEEIARMVKYANGLGIRVRMISDDIRTGNSATWSLDPPTIEIFTKDNKSKTKLILTFLHELAHHIYWIHNGKPEIPEAYLTEDNREKDSPPISKSERKAIYDYERLGIQYMRTIAIELDLKIPMWKVDMAQEYDLWVYEYYYESGYFPKNKICLKMKRALLNKYKTKGTK